MNVGLNRASSIYLCVVAVFTVGIWVIIELGSAYLTAPRDLDGKWRLEANRADEQPDASTPDASTLDAFTIDQSGKYLRFTFENGPSNGTSIDVVLTQTSNAPGGINRQSLSLDGQGWYVVGTGPEVGNEVDFTFQPPASIPAPHAGTYRRERIDQANAPASKPATRPEN